MGSPSPVPSISKASTSGNLALRAIHALPQESRYALTARMGQGLLLLLAVAVMTTRYSIEFQGLFFVYLSLAALFPLADFGLSYAVVQTGSHLTTVGNASMLAGFNQKARAQGTLISVVSLIWIGITGSALLHDGTSSTGLGLLMMKSWWALAISSAALQWANLELARLEGLHSATAAWRARCHQEWLGGAALIISLAFNIGLWSFTVQAVVRAAVAIRAVAPYFIAISGGQLGANSTERFIWQREVWPFQWRIGVSAIAGYLIFQAFNPILLVQQGPAAAGKFGLSLSIMNMLLMVTSAWPLSQAARWGAWLSEGKSREAHAYFRRTCRASSLLAATLAAFAVVGLAIAKYLDLAIADRTADLLTTALLLTLGCVHHIVNCTAVLLRAQRQEPLLMITVVGSLLNALGITLASHYGPLWLVAASSLALGIGGLAYVSWQYRLLTIEHYTQPLTRSHEIFARRRI